MTVSCAAVAQAIMEILFIWILFSSICAKSTYADHHNKILNELNPAFEDYGELPNVLGLIDLASNATKSPGIARSAGRCGGYITLKDRNLHEIFQVKKNEKICSSFFQTDKGWKLTFEVNDLKLFPCEEEYLYLNDGATLESTLCDGKAFVASQGSRFLFVKYGRRTNTGTAFNFTVRAVPRVDTKPGIGNKNRLLEQSFFDGQICQSCGSPGPRAGRGRLLGGAQARVVEYPWMVGVHASLRKVDPNSGLSKDSVCGASVLDRRHVLTAAHCIKSSTTNQFPRIIDLFVVAGSDLGFGDQRNDVNAQKIKVESWYSHPLYNPDHEEGKSYDIAILRLSEELQFNEKVSPVCLAAPVDFLGSDVTVTGYGMLLNGESARRLQAVKLTIRHSQNCHDVFNRNNNEFNFQSHQVCLYSPSKDACGGDSGGPAVLHWNGKFYQVGVVSFGFPCSDHIEHRHGGYTRVSSFIPWIKTVLNHNYSC